MICTARRFVIAVFCVNSRWRLVNRWRHKVVVCVFCLGFDIFKFTFRTPFMDLANFSPGVLGSKLFLNVKLTPHKLNFSLKLWQEIIISDNCGSARNVLFKMANAAIFDFEKLLPFLCYLTNNYWHSQFKCLTPTVHTLFSLASMNKSRSDLRTDVVMVTTYTPVNHYYSCYFCYTCIDFKAHLLSINIVPSIQIMWIKVGVMSRWLADYRRRTDYCFLIFR